MTSADLLALAERLDRETGNRDDDAMVALALGWTQRRVTRLGINGRTPGSMRWFSPVAHFGYQGTRNPPRFTGPRHRLATAAALRARAATEQGG